MGKLRTNSIVKANQIGVSLVETMVALFILAVGTLGVLAMQVNALRVNQNAYLFSQAGFLANEMYEIMKAAPRDSLDQFVVDTDPGVVSCDFSSRCSEAEMRQFDIHTWYNNISDLLPDGTARVENPQGTRFNIVVSFTQQSLGDTGAADSRSTYSLPVEF